MSSTRRTPTASPVSWSQILVDAVQQPGVISSAYHAFWNYSTGNQLLAMFECIRRKLEPGPIHTFGGWLKLKRHVRKGERAITLCMPVTVKAKQSADERDEPVEVSSEPGLNSASVPHTTTRFLYKPHWFVLAQTDGEPFIPVSVPDWDERHASHNLMIDRVPFTHTNGNCQGYAAGRQFAVSPVAYLPHRTCFHEIAHIVLGHTEEQVGLVDHDERTPKDVREVEAEAVSLICCQSLGLAGAEFSRGYLQHWLGSQKIEERSAQKIFKAADRILKAGRSEESPDASQASLFTA